MKTIVHTGNGKAKVLPRPLKTGQVRLANGARTAPFRDLSTGYPQAFHRYGPVHLTKTTHRDQCRYIAGTDGICCGQKTLKDLSYCREHFRRCNTGNRR
jgi:hypothetical protein